MQKWMTVLVVLIVIMLSGCYEYESKIISESEPSDWVRITDRLFRTTDEQAGVVCWIYSSVYRGGLTCLPIEMTSFNANNSD